MTEEFFFRLATKYISQEASIEETDQLHSLMKQKKYADLFRRISTKWKDVGERESLQHFNVEKGFHILAAKIRTCDPSFQWEKKRKPAFTMVFQFHSFRIGNISRCYFTI